MAEWELAGGVEMLSLLCAHPVTLYSLKLQNKTSFFLSCIVQWIFFGEVERNVAELP